MNKRWRVRLGPVKSSVLVECSEMHQSPQTKGFEPRYPVNFIILEEEGISAGADRATKTTRASPLYAHEVSFSCFHTFTTDSHLCRFSLGWSSLILQQCLLLSEYLPGNPRVSLLPATIPLPCVVYYITVLSLFLTLFLSVCPRTREA